MGPSKRVIYFSMNIILLSSFLVRYFFLWFCCCSGSQRAKKGFKRIWNKAAEGVRAREGLTLCPRFEIDGNFLCILKLLQLLFSAFPPDLSASSGAAREAKNNGEDGVTAMRARPIERKCLSSPSALCKLINFFSSSRKHSGVEIEFLVL